MITMDANGARINERLVRYARRYSTSSADFMRWRVHPEQVAALDGTMLVNAKTITTDVVLPVAALRTFVPRTLAGIEMIQDPTIDPSTVQLEGQSGEVLVLIKNIGMVHAAAVSEK